MSKSKSRVKESKRLQKIFVKKLGDIKRDTVVGYIVRESKSRRYLYIE